MSVIDAIYDVVEAAVELIRSATKAFVIFMVMIFVTIPVSGILSDSLFNAAEVVVEERPNEQAVVANARTAYDIIGTFQDGLEVLKVFWPVYVAAVAFIATIIAVLKKFEII